MTRQNRKSVPSRFAATFALATVICLASSAHATITWSGGTNTVGADQTLQDTAISVTGGTNTVLGLAGPPPGSTSGGTLRLIGGGTGLQITGATITLNSDNTSPGRLLLQGNVSTSASSVTAVIASEGAATVHGSVDLGAGTRIFSVASGTVPAPGADLSIAADVSDGGVEKTGAGIIALSGNNTYAGGTMLDAGTFYINSATAIGMSFFTVSGLNTTIDNKSGGPLTLSNNNQFNLSGGDLNFGGSSDLNLGTGIMVMSNANRSINVMNSAATLTIGGRIQDAGQNRGLTKTGAGTLVLNGDNLFGGLTTVNEGALFLNGSTSNGVSVSANSTFVNNGAVNGNVSDSGTMSGTGPIHGSLVVNNGGVANFSGGTMTIDGAVTNNGTFILRNSAQLAGGTGFVNNATLDLTTAGGTPNNLTNNGTIIDASVVKTKTVAKAGNTVTLTINSFTGHTYQLQKATTTPAGASFTSNIGSAQAGSTGNVLTFTDPNGTGAKAFYRIAVDS